jgi:arylsulfatase A-like enzyme
MNKTVGRILDLREWSFAVYWLDCLSTEAIDLTDMMYDKTPFLQLGCKFIMHNSSNFSTHAFNRVPFWVLVFVSVSVVSGSTPSVTADERPNIIFILADDLGFNQLGCYGDTPIKTPHLDRLAGGGIRFTQAYSGNTVCSPSRVSLFTGRDGRLMDNNSNTVQLRDIDVTIAHVLKHAGYDTALFGKYSIGSQMGVTDPLAMGFDSWYGMYSILEGHRQYPHFLWRNGKRLRIEANEGGKKGAYAQELFAKEAIDYIKQAHTNPFFVFLAFSSPHAELDAPAEYVQRYEQQFSETPYSGMSTGSPSDKYAWYYPQPVEKPHAVMAAMVTALDDYVGQIVQVLKKQGQADNTLIFFSSDNGPHDEGGGDPKFFKASAPYKGMKRDVYDGGIHVPMIVHWPRAVRKARVDDTPWAFADVLPTVAEVAGVSLHTVPRVKTNGVSIMPLLNDAPGTLPDRTLYWEFGKQAGDPNSGIVGEVFQAARRGRWKAVRYGLGAPVELYNLDDDPGETEELSESEPAIHRRFLDLFEEHAGTLAE